MANMSYCRFRNTLMDLQDCFQSLNGEFDYESIEELSRDELQSAISMMALCEEMKQFEDALNEESEKRFNAQ